MFNCEALYGFVAYSPQKQRSKPNIYRGPQEIPLTYPESSPEYNLTKSAASTNNVFKGMESEKKIAISLALGLLSVSGPAITDAYLEALPTLYPGLKILRLSECSNITKAGLQHVEKLALKSLQIKDCPQLEEEVLLLKGPEEEAEAVD